MTSFSSDIVHHFFKVYIPSHSSHNLKIPTSFIQKMNGGVVIPGGVSILKDPLGRIWQVDVVEKVENTFYFQTGWREFVEANCLNLGDFMVFGFMGNSVFNVTIFDNTGCEKNNNNLEEIGEEKQELKQEQEKGEEDIDEEKQELKQEQEGEGEGGDGEEDIGEEKEQEQEQGEGEGEGDYEFAAFDEPKNPYFISSVRMTRPYDLHIPKAVVKDNDVVLKPRMEFLDQNKVKWPIRVCFRKDGRRIITKGWKDFWTRNNLTPHDKCIFEFKQDEEIGSTSTIIQVSIVRATPRVKGL